MRRRDLINNSVSNLRIFVIPESSKKNENKIVNEMFIQMKINKGDQKQKYDRKTKFE